MHCLAEGECVAKHLLNAMQPAGGECLALHADFGGVIEESVCQKLCFGARGFIGACLHSFLALAQAPHRVMRSGLMRQSTHMQSRQFDRNRHVRHPGIGQQCAPRASCVTGCLQMCHDRETGTESSGGLCNKGLKKRTMQGMCTRKKGQADKTRQP